MADEERTRAARFHFERDRNHYIVGRATLRQLLSEYVGIKPQELNIGYTTHDKPYLIGYPELSFNLSHSGELVVYAFGISRKLGIDIEKLRPIADAQAIAERFFSPNENLIFQALPIKQQQQAFFNIWTRKEAYIKAIGEGLSHPLASFDVSCDEQASLLETRPDKAEASRWSMQNLAVRTGYTGALVVEGQDWTLKYYERTTKCD